MNDQRGEGPIPVESRSILRSGMNFQDRNRAKQMKSEGCTVQEVSAKLKVDSACIQNFFDHWDAEAKEPTEPTEPTEPKKETKPRPRAQKS